MPGIMGVIQISSDIDSDRAIEIIDKMESLLRHKLDYLSNRLFIHDHGVFSASLGHKGNVNHPWNTDAYKGILYGACERSKEPSNNENFRNTPALNDLDHFQGFYSLALFEKNKEQIVVAVDKRSSEPI